MTSNSDWQTNTAPDGSICIVDIPLDSNEAQILIRLLDLDIAALVGRTECGIRILTFPSWAIVPTLENYSLELVCEWMDDGVEFNRRWPSEEDQKAARPVHALFGYTDDDIRELYTPNLRFFFWRRSRVFYHGSKTTIEALPLDRIPVECTGSFR
jgi:hypothetical protein